MVESPWSASSNCTMTPRSLWTRGGARTRQSPLIRGGCRPAYQTAAVTGAEKLWGNLCYSASSGGRRHQGEGFPRCLISHINHTIFMTITRAAVASSVLRGSSVENNIDWRLNRAAENKVSRSGTEWEDVFPSALRNVMSVQRRHASEIGHNEVKILCCCTLFKYLLPHYPLPPPPQPVYSLFPIFIHSYLYLLLFIFKKRACCVVFALKRV